jgi:hypothetical protein
MRNLIHKLLRHCRTTLSVAMGRTEAGRLLTVLPEDVFIVSYPKSGNTWTRFLIGNLIHQDEPVTFANVELKVPSIYIHPDRVLRSRPRILKSHECFDPRYSKVLYIVRDPRDVAVSTYHYFIKMGRIPDSCTMLEFVPRWIKQEFEPTYGPWGDHVQSWLSTRQDSGRFLLLRYEDMLENTHKELERIAHFLRLTSSTARLDRAIELSTADRMRKLEKSEGQKWTMIKSGRKDRPFVRSARAGDWRSVLPPESLAQIEEAWGSIMQVLGYETCILKAKTPQSRVSPGDK